MTMSFASLGLLKDIDVRLTVELGSTDMRLRDVCGLAEGQVVMLDRLVDEPLDLLVNGKVIARGEVVAEGNRFGLRIIEMVGEETEPEQERRAPPITVATAAGGSAGAA